jgi:hypothetical protein
VDDSAVVTGLMVRGHGFLFQEEDFQIGIPELKLIKRCCPDDASADYRQIKMPSSFHRPKITTVRMPGVL